MEQQNSTVSNKPMTLEESTRKIIKDSKKMTKEEVIELFKSIGMLTKEGEFAPEFQNLKYWRPAS